MKLISAQSDDDIQAKVKARFAEFNRTSSPSKGRRYPEELRALVNQAVAKGATLSTLRDLTGVSSSVLCGWAKGGNPTTAAKARRLKVVGVSVSVDKSRQPIIIRLPSGVSIEVSDSKVISGNFLVALASLGGSHATSR